MDVDCSTKAANDSSKKVFSLIKDNELEITMTFSWWQFRKLTNKIGSFCVFSFLLFQESCAFKSDTATANTEFDPRITCRRRDGAFSPVTLLVCDCQAGSQARSWARAPNHWRERLGRLHLFGGLGCRTKPVLIQLLWRRMVWLLLCSALSFTCESSLAVLKDRDVGCGKYK